MTLHGTHEEKDAMASFASFFLPHLFDFPTIFIWTFLTIHPKHVIHWWCTKLFFPDILSNSYHVPDTVLGTEFAIMNHGGKNCTLLKLTLSRILAKNAVKEMKSKSSGYFCIKYIASLAWLRFLLLNLYSMMLIVVSF